jgi:hypothetical protein
VSSLTRRIQRGRGVLGSRLGVPTDTRAKDYLARIKREAKRNGTADVHQVSEGKNGLPEAE